MFSWTQNKKILTDSSASLDEVDSGIFSSLSDAFHPLLTEGFSCSKNCKCDKCKKPVDCVLSDWQIAGPCSTACGPGMANHVRNIIADAKNGGECPPSREEMRPCKLRDCPDAVDCVIGDWTPSGPCDYSGHQPYIGRVTTQPANGGRSCGPTTKIMSCVAPVDCIAGEWSDKWLPLDKDIACGTTVTQKKTRTMIPPKNGGKCPDPSTEKTQLYTAPPCAMDCVAGGWSEWIPLEKDVECGKTVTQTKTRTITPAMYGGKCDKLPSETRPYAAPACDVRNVNKKRAIIVPINPEYTYGADDTLKNSIGGSWDIFNYNNMPLDFINDYAFIWDYCWNTESLSDNIITLYKKFLIEGGAIFMHGEHAIVAPIRNRNIASFIKTMGGGDVSIDNNYAEYDVVTFKSKFLYNGNILPYTIPENGKFINFGNGEALFNESGAAAIWSKGTMSLAPKGCLVAYLDINTITPADKRTDFIKNLSEILFRA